MRVSVGGHRLGLGVADWNSIVGSSGRVRLECVYAPRLITHSLQCVLFSPISSYNNPFAFIFPAFYFQFSFDFCTNR